MMKLGMISGFKDNDFDYVKSKGLEFIELCCNFDRDVDNFLTNLDSAKANIARTGIKIGSVGRWNSLPNDHCKFNAQQMELQYKLIDAAVAVGSPTFVCGCNYSKDDTLFKNYSFAIEYFGKILEYANGRINVAVYNCDWENFVYSAEQYKIVMPELPELGIKWDCSHSINRGEDYLSTLSDWGDRVKHVHIKGTSRTATGRSIADSPAGLDMTNWGMVFSILYDRHYDGCLSLEPHSSTWAAGSELGDKGIDFAIKHIRPYIF